MPRILLATEGICDEIIGGAVIRATIPCAEIDNKRFKSRGFKSVCDALPVLARAGHFGLYDLLVVHVDLDDTLAIDATNSVADSPRFSEVQKVLSAKLAELSPCNRQAELRIVLMAPSQSTDAWASWGIHGQRGMGWEQKHRHALKRMLYGDPPRGMSDKATEYAANLASRLSTESVELWPQSLRSFTDALAGA